jgi:membrane-bound lytic murein transglycosylase B
MLTRAIAAFFAILALAAPAQAARCGGDFNAFISEFSREAAAAGISRDVIGQALGGVTHDPAVMAFDRRQRGTFRKTFEEYAATRVTAPRVKRARTLMARHAQLLARVEQRFGAPKELIVAIWTMETDNGGDMGKLPVVRTRMTAAAPTCSSANCWPPCRSCSAAICR